MENMKGEAREAGVLGVTLQKYIVISDCRFCFFIFLKMFLYDTNLSFLVWFSFSTHVIEGSMLWKKSFVVVQSLIHVQLFATPWTAARQASLSLTEVKSSLRTSTLLSHCLTSVCFLPHHLTLVWKYSSPSSHLLLIYLVCCLSWISPRFISWNPSPPHLSFSVSVIPFMISLIDLVITSGHSFL